ncbi:hypothetical protein V1520DRAFT_337512 [Lipomyces starkeyi]|uniref:FAD-binding FR-type domain-containing protein n=1 Tax=Lipomyces starkeyi NRRL Y-11557 TaxID=675824 RepID=A0A1E3QCE3_LIPST|nr:hypothetical protein LIPSTDRAFT_69432 [Lipomyces starkeyi NRRL Y-11557]
MCKFLYLSTCRLPLRLPGYSRKFTRQFATTRYRLKDSGDNAKPNSDSSDLEPIYDTIHPSSPYKRLTFEPPRLPNNPASDTTTIATSSPDAPIKPRGRLRRHLPLFLGLGTSIWLMWFVKTIFLTEKIDPADSASAPALDPLAFSTFVLTHRQEVGRDCVLLELSPPWEKVRHLQERRTRHKVEEDPRDPVGAGDPGIAGYWDGSRVWSVEVKQPDLQIARKYTPLPIYYVLGLKPVGDEEKEDANKKEVKKMELERTALLRMVGDNEADEAKLVLLVRKYGDGEVSRWLYSRPVGSRIQLRGPHTQVELSTSVQPRSITNLKRRYKEHKAEDTPLMRRPMLDNPSKMPPELHPDARDIVFFAGGTGIAPALQLLLSKNPIPGKMILHYSVRDRKDIAFARFLYFIEKTGRAEVHYHIDTEGTGLKTKHIPKPWTESDEAIWRKSKKAEAEAWDIQQYKSAVELHDAQIKKGRDKTLPKPVYAIVCGPEAYVEYVAGKRADVTTVSTPIGREDHVTDDKEKVGGLLSKKGWDETNVCKL